MRMVWGYRHHLPSEDYEDRVPLSLAPMLDHSTMPRRTYEIYESAFGVVIVFQMRAADGLFVARPSAISSSSTPRAGRRSIMSACIWGAMPIVGTGSSPAARNTMARRWATTRELPCSMGRAFLPRRFVPCAGYHEDPLTRGRWAPASVVSANSGARPSDSTTGIGRLSAPHPSRISRTRGGPLSQSRSLPGPGGWKKIWIFTGLRPTLEDETGGC